MLLELLFDSNSVDVVLSREVVARTATIKHVAVDVKANKDIPYLDKLNHIRVAIPWIRTPIRNVNTPSNYTFDVGTNVILNGSNYMLAPSHINPDLTFELSSPFVPQAFTMQLYDSAGNLLFTDAGNSTFNLDLHVWIDLQ